MWLRQAPKSDYDAGVPGLNTITAFAPLKKSRTCSKLPSQAAFQAEYTNFYLSDVIAEASLAYGSPYLLLRGSRERVYVLPYSASE